MGIKANGKAFKIQVFDILRFENGRVVKHWGLTDTATMMEQLK
ncbi:MAG: ester cyclase [Planctomycetes bacterium]|nr:ester cyclase [Planctomycetota bacterium]